MIVANKDAVSAYLDNENSVSKVKATEVKTIPLALYEKLRHLGIIDAAERNTNVGASNYSEHIIQPWAIWQEYDLNAWDADIIKRVLRTKSGESEELDYKKIIHICEERLRQLNSKKDS